MTKYFGIVPIKGEALAPAAPTPNLTYHQGTLLTSVEVYTIFWGTGWQPAPQNGLIQQLNNFFDFILTSSLMDLLGEYSVPGKTIGHGRRVGTQTITTSDPGMVNPLGVRVVTDAQIEQALQGWIINNTIPQPNNNTLFFVYLPPNVTSELDGFSSCVRGGYCGYHSAINGTIFYAVEPFVNCAGCTSGQNQPFDSLTEVSSHELCEAITDPDPFHGWNDDNLTAGEIGDICNFQATQLGGYNVQKEWSNKANACRLGPPSQGLAAERTENAKENEVLQFGGRPAGVAAGQLIGNGFAYRHDWGNLNNQNILHLNWGAITANSKVFVAIGEGAAGGGKFIGGARYTLYNVAPQNGVVSIWVNIEWNNPLRLSVDYFAVND